MISCFLLLLAIPLAIFGSPPLRLAVWLYNGLAGWLLPAPRRRPTLDLAAATLDVQADSDQVTNKPRPRQVGVTTIPTAEPAGASEGGTDSSTLPVPAYKMSVATVFLALLATAIVSGFGKLVVMALLEITRKGGGGLRPDYSTVYTVVEFLLLPLGFLLMVLLLQTLLDADFWTASLIALFYLVLFVVLLLIAVGLLTLWFLLIGWVTSLFKPALLVAASLAVTASPA